MSEDFKYDEDNAIKFIKAFIPEESSEKFSDDDILFVIDCIWDYYEDNGFLDISADADDETLDIDLLVDYVYKAILKDGEIKASKDEIKIIINAELQYDESIENFDI